MLHLDAIFTNWRRGYEDWVESSKSV